MWLYWLFNAFGCIAVANWIYIFGLVLSVCMGNHIFFYSAVIFSGFACKVTCLISPYILYSHYYAYMHFPLSFLFSHISLSFISFFSFSFSIFLVIYFFLILSCQYGHFLFIFPHSSHFTLMRINIISLFCWYRLAAAINYIIVYFFTFALFLQLRFRVKEINGKWLKMYK